MNGAAPDFGQSQGRLSQMGCRIRESSSHTGERNPLQ